MATPIGHGLAGVGLFLLMRSSLRSRGLHLLVIAGLVAILPDFDFLPGMLVGKPALYHHGISHSVGFALAVAILGTLALRRWAPRHRTGVVFSLLFSAYTSHLLLDYLGGDSRPPHGIPVLWPLSSQYYLSPIEILPGVRHVGSADGRFLEWLQGVLTWHNMVSVGIELVWLLPLILAFWWIGRHSDSRTWPVLRREARRVR